MSSKAADNSEDKDHTMASPPPAHPKLPEVEITSPSFSSPPTTMNMEPSAQAQAPAQLALLLSNALADVDSLRRELAEEKRRTARVERLLSSFHPMENGNGEPEKKKIPEEALKAILEAEVRAESAERSRDDALHALRTLVPNFTDLDRYEVALHLRASDARSAFARLLNSTVASNPPPVTSPTLSHSRSPESLALPGLPPPLPAPTTNGQYLSGPGAPPPSHLYSYTHALPSATPSFSYAAAPPSYLPHSRPNNHSHTQSPFSSLPLPPPPSATGLGVALVPPPPSTSSSFSVPARRVHRSRNTRALEEGSKGEEVGYGESKRRRVTGWETGMAGERDELDGPLPYPQHQPPMSPHPTQSVYERSCARSGRRGRDWDREASGYAHHGINGHPVNGLGRVDARQLVRDAKERERQGVQPHIRQNKRRRSVSRSSGSSWSIDEMLLETATATERDARGCPLSPSAHRSPPGRQQYPYPSRSFASPNAPLPPSVSNAQLQVEGSYPKKAGSHSSQASSGSAGGVGEKERNGTSKVPSTQLVTLGPSGTVVSGGGPATSSYPPQNTSGQRICRQCGVPGRYKEGKCVEKWGPGPEGPGTVCDRCRKKMKRVERRGTLDGASASAHQQSFIVHRHSQSQNQNQSQLQAQPTLPVSTHSPSTNRARTIIRTDTLLVGQNSQVHPQPRTRLQGETQSTMLSQSQGPAHLHAYSSERERDIRKGDESHNRSPLPSYHPAPGWHGQGQGQDHRRARTPPHTNPASTHGQHDDDGDGEDDASGEMDVDAEIAQAASAGTNVKAPSRNTHRNSLANGMRLAHSSAPGSSRASSTSTSAFDKPNGVGSGLSRVTAPQQRDMVDEFGEDDAEGDDADADADIMDAVEEAMKVEE